METGMEAAATVEAWHTGNTWPHTKGETVRLIVEVDPKHRHILIAQNETRTLHFPRKFCRWTGWEAGGWTEGTDPHWRIPPSEMSKVRAAFPDEPKHGPRWDYPDRRDEDYWPA